MNQTVTDRFTIRDAIEIYGLEGWGNGYFSISDEGHLVVSPRADSTTPIDVFEAVRRLAERGIHTPVLLRLPQLLAAQVENLTGAFASAIHEYDYGEAFQPVFPLKVNQVKGVVDSLLESGRSHGMGIEVGSRPELMAAAAMPLADRALIICNGFKDPQYLASAALAARMGKRVVVVIEKPFELEPAIEQVSHDDDSPLIGFRIRLQARGSGLWEKSGGNASKFGLTTQQLLAALERLEAVGLSDQVALLHFHIGSQVTEIRKIKTAILEAARIYAKLRQQGVLIRYLDVGGGLGIDYDGSKTSSDASVNYSVQEYANDVVFGVSEVCEQEDVPPPRIICEAGRMLTAYHSVLVTDVRGVISGNDLALPEETGGEPQVIQDLGEVARTITVKNYREFYHDAVEYRDQMYALFNLGMLDLEGRAKGETYFWIVAHKAVRYSKSAKFVAEEFVDLEARLHDKYICNFSVFQSLPDHWALDQLFPVMPIHRLDTLPERRASLVDITCDSDGEVEKFVDLKDIKDTLEVHGLIPDEPYYIGFLLVGAYQDTMGDLHNLFGRVHEAEVVMTEDGRTEIRNVRPGEPARETMRWFGYEADALIARIGEGLATRVEFGHLTEDDAQRLLAEYRERLGQYTYLD